MDKLSFFCVTQFIQRFECGDESEINKLLQDIPEWLSSSVIKLVELNSFNNVQQELLNVAQYIVQGKTLTRRSCNKLIETLKDMQKEMLSKMQIVLFVTPTIKVEFNENITKILVENQDECIDKAYNMQDELKYLLYMENENISEELKNAVDIVLSFEELLEEADKCFPIDDFTYDRLYLTAKLSKIQNEQSRILLAGSSYTMTGLLENKMPYPSVNLAVNAQDLYYTLLSVKEAISRSQNMDTIVISFAYYFFFSNMNDNPSDYMLSILSKIIYPIYKKLNGYKGELKEISVKVDESPICEAIVDISVIRDLYYSAVIKELGNMQYFNRIKKRPEYGLLNYSFLEKTDEQNFAAGKVRAEGHNAGFDIDRGVINRELLDKFLDNMEELNKKIILFIPPATKFYKESVSKDMINSYQQLVMPIVNSHKCCALIDLFNSQEFNEQDFQDYDHVNEKGAEKLSEIIAKYIKENE